MMRVAAVQLDIAWEDKPANFSRVRALLADTPPAPGSLIVLPEMFACGFSMNLAADMQSFGEDGVSARRQRSPPLRWSAPQPILTAGIGINRA